MPAPRPRTRVVAPAGRKPIAVVYNPKDYTEWKQDAAKQAKLQMTGEPFEGPVAVTLQFTAPRPKTTKLAVQKPDIDNYDKGALAAPKETKIVWPKDSQLPKPERKRG